MLTGTTISPKTRSRKWRRKTGWWAGGEWAVGGRMYLWHLGVGEHPPQLLDRQQANQGRDKEANPLDARNTANGDTSEEHGQLPLPAKGLVALVAEEDVGEKGGGGKGKEHRVEEDEAGDADHAVLWSLSGWEADGRYRGGRGRRRGGRCGGGGAAGGR